jgi:serine/threonine protein kinase
MGTTNHTSTIGVASRFRSLRRIGAGGMGIVYEAIDTWSGATVALKMAYARKGGRRQANHQLRCEAVALALVDDPHVCDIYDLTRHAGRLCLVLERLVGETLQARILRGRVATRELLDVAIQATTALQAIHAAGLVHQDIKPANILLTGSGVKVLDFGIAVPAGAPSGGASGTPGQARPAVLGSPNYVSPERLLRRPADPRSDLFSLGVVLYEMATGVPPFTADTPAELLLNVLEARPQSVAALAPDRPAALAALVHDLLARRAKDRCQTAGEVLERLHSIRRGCAGGSRRRRPAVAA